MQSETDEIKNKKIEELHRQIAILENSDQYSVEEKILIVKQALELINKEGSGVK